MGKKQKVPITEPEPNGPGPDTGLMTTEEGKTTDSDIPEREKWGGKADFLLSCIGYAVGLGNVWRFPYLCFKNGGGAFLIPYLICALGAGFPVFFLEVAMGQFTSEGCVTVWKMCPLFKGIGYGTVAIVCLLNFYYIIVMAWAFLYMFYSFTSVLPWSHCDNPWNTNSCAILSKNFYGNMTKEERQALREAKTFVDSASEFWDLKILQRSSGVGDPGPLNWQLALTLLLSWIIIYFVVWKSVKSSGKVVYFTATFPYVMLTILLIRGATLEGAAKGIIFYLRPDFARLGDAEVWMEAGSQIFLSYAIATSALIALGSYNKHNNNCYRDSWIICIINSCTSIYAGFVIFSVLGYMASSMEVDVSEVAEGGPGLAFIAYPKAVTMMPVPTLWAILFFFMILLLGVDSQFVGVEGFLTAVVDLFPQFLRKGYNREIFTAVVCFLSFIVGLSMVTQGGVYVFNLFNTYAAAGFCLLWFCFWECIAIGWVYGSEKFYRDIELMIGYKINAWMKICWLFISPLICLFIFIFSFVKYKLIDYEGVPYPLWGDLIGWCLALSSMIWIPVYLIYAMLTAKGTFSQRWTYLTTPTLAPELQAHHKGRTYDPIGIPIISRHLFRSRQYQSPEKENYQQTTGV